MNQRRYYGLDALRGVMMMLGIVLHSAALHMKAPVLELSLDPATSPIFLIVVLFIHNFRMPLFFVLAGFFASLLVKKYEFRGALVNRAKRVLGPLLLGMITILPLMGVFAISYGASVRFGEWQFLASWEQLLTLESEIAEQLQILGTKTGLDVPVGNELSPGHLWFLYYLLYFYLAIPVCQAAVNWANQTRYRSRISSGLTSPLLLPALGLLTGLTVLPYPAAQVFGGFLFFKPHVPSLLYYGSFFVFGYFIHSFLEILEVFKNRLGWYGLLALILAPAALLASSMDLLASDSSMWLHYLAAGLNGLSTWMLIFFFLGLFLHYFDFDSPWIVYISQSSYWVYLLHGPTFLMVGWLLLPLHLNVFLKFGLEVVGTSVICFVTYHYLVRTSWVGVLLHGRRFNMDWPWVKKRNSAQP